MRLFLGLSIPLPIIAELRRQLEEVKEVLSVGNWIRDENLHITLVFIGEVQPQTADALHPKLLAAAQDTNPFSLCLQGWGAFPNMRKPNLLWAGVGGDREPLNKLVNSLQEAIHPIIPLRRDRRYLPHVTLTRRFHPDRPILCLNQDYPLQTSAWTVKQMHVYRSHLSPQGARYEILNTYPFKSSFHSCSKALHAKPSSR